MFSSKELLTFVFANENDTYYGEDLLKRNLHQYLWEQLHPNFSAVYFLSAENNSFQVHTFGDCCCHEFIPGKKTLLSMFGSNTQQKEFGDWLHKQLRAKPSEAAAFVCSLEDFCTVFSDSRWDSVLNNIAEEKKRTGIFVLTASATAEQSSALLLESPVFQTLQDPSVTSLRSDACLELYRHLKKEKMDGCLFLNGFSLNRLRALLIQLIMEQPQRFDHFSQLDSLAEYLYAVLRDPELYDREPLFPADLPSIYLTYKKLYDLLSDNRNWTLLLQNSKTFDKSLSPINRRSKSEEYIPILRDRNSYAGRCIRLRLPAWLTKDPDFRIAAQSLLRNICTSVSSPKNKPEHPQIVDYIYKYLDALITVAKDDSESYLHILTSLQFCVEHVYAEPESEKTTAILKIAQTQNDSIIVFRNCFQLQQDLINYNLFGSQISLQATLYKEMEGKYSVLKTSKKKYKDLIHIQKNTLPMSVNIQDVVKNLEEEINDLIRNTNESATSDTNKLTKLSVIPDDALLDEKNILKLKYM